MNSPVDIYFQSFIKIDRKNSEAVYMQIVYQFINAVNLKLLEEGDLLPGTRKISEALNVHRKTVVAAMAELQEQGWVDTVPNVGTFVKNPIEKNHLSGKPSPQHPQVAAYDYRRESIIDIPVPENQGKYYFTDGTVDDEMIDNSELVRFYAGVLKRKKRIHFLQHVVESNVFFRDQLSFYLNLTRGFHLSRNVLLPISSREKVFSILARLLIDVGDVILVGQLSHFLPNMIFSQAGAKLKTIPVDQEGIDVDYIERAFRPGEVRCLYLNSLCHYPTTARLPTERKDKLLKLAEEYKFIIIEDDEDFEFSTLKAKTQSIFQKDGGRRVIYVGAFGKFLGSSFQMNFLITPPAVLEEAKKYLNIFGKTDFLLEKTLGEIIQQGDIFRYQRKSQKIITARKMVFAQLLENYFGKTITYYIPESGLAFWILFEENFSLLRLHAKALENGLLIPKTCLYQNRTITALRLGFAHLNHQDMEDAVILLHKSYMNTIN